MDIEEQYDKIYRYCYFRLHDRQLAQDLTQETFLRFYRQDLGLDNGKELPYLYTVARNLCIDEFRKRKFGCMGGIGTGIDIDDVSAKDISTVNISTVNISAENFSTENKNTENISRGNIRIKAGNTGSDGMAAACDNSEEWIDSMILRDAIEKLPQEEQELLFLRYVNEASVASICKITGISRFAVYRRISKSLKWLKKELIKEGFSE